MTIQMHAEYLAERRLSLAYFDLGHEAKLAIIRMYEQHTGRKPLPAEII